MSFKKTFSNVVFVLCALIYAIHPAFARCLAPTFYLGVAIAVLFLASLLFMWHMVSAE